MKPEDIKESLDENIEFLKREIKRGAPIGELRHLTGRIGELYVADKYNGEMPASVNQAGYDVKANGEKISIKTTSRDKGSHQFQFAKSTIDKVDRVILLYISVEFNEVRIKELLNLRIEDARKLMVEREKLVISLSKTNNQDKYLSYLNNENKVDLELGEDDVIASENYLSLGFSFPIKDDSYVLYYQDGNRNQVRLIENGNEVQMVKPKLIEIISSLGLEVYRGDGKKFTNKQYAGKIIRELKLETL